MVLSTQDYLLPTLNFSPFPKYSLFLLFEHRSALIMWMISTIIFDLNLTVVGVRFDDPDDRYKDKLGVSKKALFHAAVAHWEEFETGKFGQEELAQRIIKELNLSPEKGPETLRLLREDIYLVDGIEQILAGLYGKYRLIMLAGDGEDFLHAKLDKFNLKHYFSKIYCTCYEGIRKIDPQIYHNVLVKERIAPSDCLFIDDNPEFIGVAQSIGIHTILFANSSQLREDLEKFSIFI
ncbi:MAG: D-glucose-1-phosphatase [Promethearchaeota archaeon CR_4]|nr:MAG: D-glucose-1-phosphatase [Candidatus Lokiarchaeota archaeon CR_4]